MPKSSNLLKKNNFQKMGCFKVKYEVVKMLYFDSFLSGKNLSFFSEAMFLNFEFLLKKL